MDDEYLSNDNLWDIIDNHSISKELNINSEEIIENRINRCDKKSINLSELNSKIDKYLDDNKLLNNYVKHCIDCNSLNIIYSHGKNSYVCANCGIENQQLFDDNLEWINDDYKNESKKYNTFFPKTSLSTNINLPSYSKIQMLRKWSYIPYKERILAEVLNDIDSKCKKFKISKAVIDNAKILYKNIREIRYKDKTVIIRGVNRKQIIAACLYYGAILQRIPRSPKEISNIFDLELKQVTKGCRKFLEIMKDNFIVFDIKPFHGSDFVKRFGKQLNLSNELLDLAETISNNSTLLDIITDHQAISIAASSILLASIVLNVIIYYIDKLHNDNIPLNEISKNKKIIDKYLSNNDNNDIKISSKIITYIYKKSKLENNEISTNRKIISEIFHISDVTITKTYKKLLIFKDIIIDNDITEKFHNKIKTEIYKNIDKESYEKIIKYENTFNSIPTNSLDLVNFIISKEQEIMTHYSYIRNEFDDFDNDSISSSIILDNNNLLNLDIELDSLDESDIIKKEDKNNKKIANKERKKKIIEHDVNKEINKVPKKRGRPPKIKI